MCPTARTTTPEHFDAADATPSNFWKWFLLAILWIAAAVFLLATTGAQAQKVYFSNHQITAPATGLSGPGGMPGEPAGSRAIVNTAFSNPG
ncbi:MAG TPA: hypothetical protein VFN53_04755 [Acidobacteriaceae bacterium]|nr:hypothetical protein [Acidobacteriaceae bacterium]